MRRGPIGRAHGARLRGQRRALDPTASSIFRMDASPAGRTTAREMSTSSRSRRLVSIGRLTRVDAMQQQMTAAYRRRLETQLSQIKSAFTRLAAGTYGECLRCDEPIGWGRLSVQPETPLCVRCQGNPAP